MQETPSTTPMLHKSVLVEEVLQYLDPRPGKVYLDVTFGSGGHTRAILEKEPDCTVIALDWDKKSLDTYGLPLQEEFPARLRLVWGNFALLYKILKEQKIVGVDGILADFGTSQMQIFERPGFSLYRDTELDMRMSPPHQKTTAADIVNNAKQEELYEIFKEFGEERFAGRIARVIVEERAAKKIVTTKDLAKLVERALPGGVKRGAIHPATRIFQALRIFVNKELANIEAFLPIAFKVLNPDGRLVCISFHSLEDRVVKQFFVQCKQEGRAEILTPRIVMAQEEETKANPSARSARLRALRKLL